MQNLVQKEQTASLSRATLMFPLALVLFEFSVYIGNDLVQPAMLAITKEFGVSSAWAPSRENDISWKPFMEEMYENHSRAVRRR